MHSSEWLRTYLPLFSIPPDKYVRIEDIDRQSCLKLIGWRPVYGDCTDISGTQKSLRAQAFPVYGKDQGRGR